MTSSADFVTLGDGRALLRGTTARLVRWFDDRFLQMAREDGAVECRFPATIAGDVLTRAGYFDAHPVAPPRSEAVRPRLAAACRLLSSLCDARRNAPRRTHQVTASQTCFREADRAALTSDRL